MASRGPEGRRRPGERVSTVVSSAQRSSARAAQHRKGTHARVSQARAEGVDALRTSERMTLHDAEGVLDVGHGEAHEDELGARSQHQEARSLAKGEGR